MRSGARAVHKGQVIAELSAAHVASGGRSTGKIVGRFTGGFYARIDDCIFAVGGPRVWPGPIHLVLDRDPPPVAEGADIRLDPGCFSFQGTAIYLEVAELFAPSPPSLSALRAVAPRMALWADQGGWPDDLSAVRDEARAAAEEGDLARLAQVLEGRGTGLTPSGDDVLAGYLLTRHWVGAPPGLLLSVAENARTTDLSRSFLRWAAQGQSIAPVHRLFATMPDADGEGGPSRGDPFDQAVEVVRGVGHSSGGALLAGLGLGAVASSALRRRG